MKFVGENLRKAANRQTFGLSLTGTPTRARPPTMGPADCARHAKAFGDGGFLGGNVQRMNMLFTN